LRQEGLARGRGQRRRHPSTREDHSEAAPAHGSGVPGCRRAARHVRRVGLRGAAARLVPNEHRGDGSVPPAGAGAAGGAAAVVSSAGMPRVRGNGGGHAAAALPLVRTRRRGDSQILLARGPFSFARRTPDWRGRSRARSDRGALEVSHI
ncbi:hypothetical protein BAE44_0026051, partial [Dichanthelium oligosanthes]